MRRTRVLLISLTLLLAASVCIAASGNVQGQWWGRAPGVKPAVRGAVDSVSPTSITVKTDDAVRAFAVVHKTRVRVRGVKATIGDVKVGEPVAVHFAITKDNAPTAVLVVVRDPGVAGEITAIAGKIITLRNKNGQLQVAVTDSTEYRSRSYQGSFADLLVGYKIEAEGAVQDSVLTADIIRFVPTVARGAVIAMNGNVITVKTKRQFTIPCQAGPATVVWVRPRIGPNKKGTLADVTVGAPVNIGIHANKGGNSPLLWIDVLTGM